MKLCNYCGRENEEAAMTCQECGGVEFRVRDADAAAVGDRAPSIDFETLKADELNNTWVTLTRCGTLVEADLIAMRLRAAEIPVFIPDEWLMQAIAFNVNAYGFVRVQVPPAQYAAALEALKSEG